MFLTYRKRGMTSRWHKAKGIEAQTCEILLLRLFKSQDFAFCHTYVISKWDQGYDRVFHESFKILLF